MSNTRPPIVLDEKPQTEKEFHKFIPFAGNSRVGLMTEKNKNFLVRMQGDQTIHSFPLSDELSQEKPWCYRLTAFHDNQHILMWHYKIHYWGDKKPSSTTLLYKINLQSGKVTNKHEINESQISHIIIAADDQRLFLRDDKKNIKIYQIDEEISCVAAGKTHGDDEHGNIFIVLPDEKRFLTVVKYADGHMDIFGRPRMEDNSSKSGGVKIWELPKDNLGAELTCQRTDYLDNQSQYTALHISEDNQHLIAGDTRSNMFIFNIQNFETPQLVATFSILIDPKKPHQNRSLELEPDGITAFTITPDDKYLVSRHRAVEGYKNILWDITDINKPTKINEIDQLYGFWETPHTFFITTDWSLIAQNNILLNFPELKTASEEYTAMKQQIATKLPNPGLDNLVFSYLFTSSRFYKPAKEKPSNENLASTAQSKSCCIMI